MNQSIQIEKVAMMFFIESYNRSIQTDAVEALTKENAELRKQIEKLKLGDKTNADRHN